MCELLRHSVSMDALQSHGDATTGAGAAAFAEVVTGGDPLLPTPLLSQVRPCGCWSHIRCGACKSPPSPLWQGLQQRRRTWLSPIEIAGERRREGAAAAHLGPGGTVATERICFVSGVTWNCSLPMHAQFAAQSCLRAAVHGMEAVRLCWGPTRYCSCHGVGQPWRRLHRSRHNEDHGKYRWVMGTIAANTTRRSRFGAWHSNELAFLAHGYSQPLLAAHLRILRII